MMVPMDRVRPAGRTARPAQATGLTLVEVLVVIAVIAILAAMILPPLSRVQARAQSVVCRNNLRQLTLAWMMYPLDHEDYLPTNWFDGQGAWLEGILNFNPYNPDNTNTLHLRTCALADYLQSIDVFKCPGDKSMVSMGGATHPRIRSVALNNHLGIETWEPGFKAFLRSAQLAEVDSSRILVMIMQREDAIEDSWYRVDMYPGGRINRPGFYHDGSENISFADGHVESHRWEEPTTVAPIRPGIDIRVWSTQEMPSDPANADVRWIWEHTTVPDPSRE